MSPQGVKKSLLDEPEKTKRIRLNDGTRIVVRGRENWLAGYDYLIVLVGRVDHHIAYRNIAEIRTLPRRKRA